MTADVRPPGAARLPDIDVGKGIAISLVVLGHVVARDIKPAGNEWFADLRDHLYVFHMSFFFYLAGYVFWTASPARYGQRARSAVQRMLPAYLLAVLLAFFAKTVVARFVPVDRPIRSFWSDSLELITYPTEAFTAFLWFIIVLLCLYGITLLAHRVLRGSLPAMMALAIVLHVWSVSGGVTKMFALHQITRYWLLFLLPYYALAYREVLTPWMARTWPLTLGLMVAMLFVLPYRWQLSVCALLSLPALHGLAITLVDHAPRVAGALSKLGGASWPIYLFSAFTMGAVKVLILKTMGWDGPRFFVALPILVASGLLLPIIVQRVFFSRWPWLDRITR